jgi:hypothetical protein
MSAKHFGAAVALAGSLASGCATITQGTSQPLTINTDPTGAICSVRKDDKEVGVVNPTPGTVQVEKGWGPLSVACKKEGHIDEEARHDSEVQGWTFGNILIGGLIGFALDAMSGAMRKYPSFVTIVLTPVSFPSAEQRDRYFDELREKTLKEAAETEDKIKSTCAPETCASQIKEFELARQAQLAQIDARRARAKVDESVAEGAPASRPERKVTLDDLPLPALEPAPPGAKQ